MKKPVFILCSLLLAALFFASCTDPHGSESGSGSENLPAESAKSADEIIKDAEKTSYLSGDADLDSLTNAGELPFGSVVPAFLQTHSPEEFPSYDGDSDFFTPTSDDYLIASFEPNKTVIYEFFHDGSLLAVRGRIVYDSKDALLRENADLKLTENACSENGYTYRGNVLYYVMREDVLFAAGYRIDKAALLRTAAAGKWDGDLYWFSKPYDDPLSSFDDEKWDETLRVLEAVIPDGEEDPEEGTLPESAPDEDTVRRLFDELMRKNGRSPEEFRESELKIFLNDGNSAYASLLYYTIPDGYLPGGKVENFLISAPLSRAESDDAWEIGDQKEFFSERKDEYYEAVLTESAHDAFKRGAFVKRFWVPFRPADPVMLKGAVAGKVIEVYEADGGELGVTVFFSNDTEKDVRITALDSLVLNSESGVVADVSAELAIDLPAGEFMYETVLIPQDFLQISSFSDVAVGELLFSTET